MDKPLAQMSLDLNEVVGLKTAAVRGHPNADRINLVLALRLLDQSEQQLDPSAVLHELDYLEGLRPTSRTKAEKPFKGQQLQSFWHKHFKNDAYGNAARVVL